MTNRQIGSHLGALALLILLGISAFWVFHSAYAVPALIRALDSSDSKARRHAAASLARLGPQAKPAVEALLKLAQPDRKLNDRTTAVGALVEVSPAAAHGLIPRYTEALRHDDPRTRYEAAMVLAELGPVGKAAIPALAIAARDSNDLVRRWAVTALGRIGVGTAESKQALFAALGDPSETVWHDALLAFSYGFLSREALQEAAPAIRAIGKDKRYAAAAANALRSLDQSPKLETELWVQTHTLKSGSGVRYALQKLARLGPAAAPALPDVIAVLGDTRPLNRYLAVETLAAIGPAAAPSLLALRERLNDDDALVRTVAAETIAVIGGTAPLASTGGKP
jgi:HEAT repeat protein